MCDVTPKGLTFEGRHNRSSPFPSDYRLLLSCAISSNGGIDACIQTGFFTSGSIFMDNAFLCSRINNALRFAKGDVLLVGCGSSYSFFDSTMDPGTDSGMSSSLLCVSFHGLYVGFYLRQLFHLPSVSFIPCYFTMFRFLWQEIFYNAVGLCKSRLFVKIKKMPE